MHTTARNNTRQSPHNSKKTLSRVLQNRVLPDTVCRLHSTHSPQRKLLEEYIQKKFSCAYNANITEFMPQFLSLDYHNRVSATAGIRRATEETLMVEHYMEKSVEQTLSCLIQKPVARESIIEIGNLVATHRGASQLLFVLLLAILHKANYRWVVFTATQQVGQLLNKLHFDPFRVCTADSTMLEDSSNHWGSYYETNPSVLAGDLQPAIEYARTNSIMNGIINDYKNVIDELATELVQGKKI